MPYAGHPAAGGDIVVITGTNFGPTAAKKALSSSTYGVPGTPQVGEKREERRETRRTEKRHQQVEEKRRENREERRDIHR